MARSVKDLRLGLSVMAGRHIDDPQSVDVPLVGNFPDKPKAALIKEIVRSIAIIPDHITRAVFTKDCSKTLQISEAILTQEIARVRRQQNSSGQVNEYTPKQPIKAPSQKKVDFYKSNYQEWEIIRFLLCYGDKEIIFFEEVEEISEAGNKNSLY